jgi:soluble lytic murein transglycosylase-like protein
MRNQPLMSTTFAQSLAWQESPLPFILQTMRNLTDALMWRGTRAAALTEAKKLTASARRMGYDIVVRGTMRRYGNTTYEERPYGVFLSSRDS